MTIAAEGGKAHDVKPMKGFGSGVFEIAVRFQTDAFRAIYVLNLDDALWVVHAFQKKSKSGIKTPSRDIQIIQDRLRRLRESLE